MAATEFTLKNLPDDILTKLISLLPVPDILSISLTSNQFRESCKSAIKQSSKFDLFLSSTYEKQDDIFDLQSINLSLPSIKRNEHIIHFLQNIWKNVDSLHSEDYSLSKIFETLQVNPSKLKNIELLHQPSHCCIKYLPHLLNLQWINLPYIGKRAWNELITECTNIKGICFQISSKTDCAYDEDE